MFPGLLSDMVMILGTDLRSVSIPPSATWVEIIMQCAGGGGYNGTSGSSATACSGNGGGGGGARSRLMIRTKFLPSTLWVKNGAGGAAGGSNGGTSILAAEPVWSATNIIVNPGLGGYGGVIPNGGSGGTVGSALALGASGHFSSLAGGAGSSGANGIPGIQISATVMGAQVGGTAGGGHSATPTNFAGGAFAPGVTGQTLFPPCDGGAVAGGAGLPAVWLPRWLICTPATGGGSNFGATGGVGGNGFMGSGGGGGGSGLTGGAGGKGGDGFTLIGWW